jgi:tetratricopeptide (TPR) repeat protein
MSSLLRLLLVALASLLPLAPAVAQGELLPDSRDAAALEAYRGGDLETARVLWLEVLEEGRETQPANQRARLCYNLGNLAGRRGDWLRAAGWYSASLRLRPRDADAWANLELARLEAGLGPADRGDLEATVLRLLTSLTDAESGWLALLGLLPLALALLGEALRGGAGWRAASGLALVLALLLVLPWLRHRWVGETHPSFVLAEKGVQARNEPRGDGSPLGELEPGTVHERTDSLPGWVELELGGGRRGWVRDSALLRLDR